MPVVLKFDAGGNLVKSFGEGLFIFPHGSHVDNEGNIWVTDARAATPEELEKYPDAKGKGHQVIKFSPDGEVLLMLGTAGTTGDPPAYLTEPSDVTTAPNGDIFITDGHGALPGSSNKVARIVKFSRDGKFIKTWGKLGSGPGDLNAPHSISLDSAGRLLVADRNNNRIQIFDQEGNFIDQWLQFSRPSGLFVDADDIVYVADSESGSVSRDRANWKRGIRIGSVKDAKVAAFIPDPDQNAVETSAAEGVAVDSEGNIYGAEVGPRGVKKYIKK